MKKLVTSIMASAMILGVSSCVDHNFEAPISYQQQIEEAFDAAFIKEFGHVHPQQDWGFGESTETKALTRTSYPNGNLWEKEGYPLDSAVTTDEKDAVFEYVLDLKQKPSTTLNLSQYIVSQVWKGDTDAHSKTGVQTPKTDSYVGNSGTTASVSGGANMDQLSVLEKIEDGKEKWADIYDFNNSGSKDWGGKMYMLESGTLNFRYYQSYTGRYVNDYIIVDGANITDRNGKNYAGYYYVCFDFEAPYLDTDYKRTIFYLYGSYEYLDSKAQTVELTVNSNDIWVCGVDPTLTVSQLETQIKAACENYIKDGNNRSKLVGSYPTTGTISNIVIKDYEQLQINDWNRVFKATITFTYDIPDIWKKKEFNGANKELSEVYTKDEINKQSTILALEGDGDKTIRNYNVRVENFGVQAGEQHFKGDDIYADWIVRITPGSKNEDPGTPTDTIPTPPVIVRNVVTHRVYAEDLYANRYGDLTNSDWDFNDVVFDVVNDCDSLVSYVLIQAAGGTLPLYLTLKGTNNSVEVHEAFYDFMANAPTDVMINTGKGPVKPAKRVLNCAGTALTAADVLIHVKHPDSEQKVEVTAYKGLPAAKFTINMADYPGLTWSAECDPIWNLFENFDEYVGLTTPLKVKEKK